MIRIVAFVTPVPGKEAQLKEKLLALLPITHKEKGCVTYALHESDENPKRFVFVEKWESMEALGSHLKAPHIAAAFALKGSLFSDIQIITLDPIPSGAAGQGLSKN